MHDWRNRRSIVVVVVLAGFCVSAAGAHAFTRYSQNKDATNCRECHLDFRSASYISLTDGMNWGNLHDLHRSTMLNGDCDVCHGSTRFPVVLNSSVGGSGLSAIGCMGCHGRQADHSPANPSWPMSGSGAGLRQHHHKTGTASCAGCHADADPANYTPVGERVKPEYYANPGTNHPAMPTDPCQGTGSENFAGAAEGLDNDGDDIYDANDSDCTTPVEHTTWGAIKSLYRL